MPKRVHEFFVPARVRNIVSWAFKNSDKLDKVLRVVYDGIPPDQIIWAALALFIADSRAVRIEAK